MICDSLKNCATYEAMHPAFKQAFAYLKTITPDNLPTDRVELDGDKVFLLRNAYTTNDPANAKFEAHRAYADVMYMVEGEETIYVKPTSQLSNITSAYDANGDYLLADFDQDATPVHLTAGSFIILLPQDAHAPGCWVDSPKDVKKIVGKVLL